MDYIANLDVCDESLRSILNNVNSLRRDMQIMFVVSSDHWFRRHTDSQLKQWDSSCAT
jgi:hypothetical protein